VQRAASRLDVGDLRGADDYLSQAEFDGFRVAGLRNRLARLRVRIGSSTSVRASTGQLMKPSELAALRYLASLPGGHMPQSKGAETRVMDVLVRDGYIKLVGAYGVEITDKGRVALGR
jgi:hypothetical protein